MSNVDKVTLRLSGKLATKSSRRGFFRFAGASAVGLGLGLHGVSLTSASCSPPCDGPSDCNPNCTSPYPACLNCQAFACPVGYTQNSWSCCIDCCKWLCAECCSGSSYCHCFIRGTIACGGCQCPQLPAVA